MTANLVRNITQLSDLEELIQLICEIIGETCWKAGLTYGNELTLHIGAKIPYLQKSMLAKEKGAWILGTRATRWRIDFRGDTLVDSNNDLETIKQKVAAIESNTITNIKISYENLALTVSFTNQSKLILLPNSEEDVDLPDWEIFTPYHMVLKFGPGAVWSYTSSNRKASIDS